MALKKCSNCGTLFNDQASNNQHEDLCPLCFREERKEFVKVRDYLWSNPGADLEELHAKTGVPKQLIQKFIRQGRFRKL